MSSHGITDQSGWEKVQRYVREKPRSEGVPYFTAKMHDRLTGWHLEKWNRTLRIEGSLPRLKHYDSNTTPLTTSDFHLLPEYLLDLSDQLGLRFNIDHLRIGRIDIFRNLEVQYPTPLVIGPLSSVLELTNMRQRTSPEFYDSPYVRWENDQRELAVYQKDPVVGAGDLLEGPWLLRFEYRLTTASSCARYGFRSFESLLDTGRQEEVLNGQLRCLLERAEARGLFDDSARSISVAETLAKVIRSRDFRIPNLAIAIAGLEGIDSIMGGFGGERGWNDFVSNLGLPRQTLKRLKDLIREILNYRNKLKGVGQDARATIKSDLLGLVNGGERYHDPNQVLSKESVSSSSRTSIQLSRANAPALPTRKQLA